MMKNIGRYRDELPVKSIRDFFPCFIFHLSPRRAGKPHVNTISCCWRRRDRDLTGLYSLISVWGRCEKCATFFVVINKHGPSMHGRLAQHHVPCIGIALALWFKLTYMQHYTHIKAEFILDRKRFFFFFFFFLSLCRMSVFWGHSSQFNTHDLKKWTCTVRQSDKKKNVIEYEFSLACYLMCVQKICVCSQSTNLN